jgi:hypothetical protein
MRPVAPHDVKKFVIRSQADIEQSCLAWRRVRVHGSSSISFKAVATAQPVCGFTLHKKPPARNDTRECVLYVLALDAPNVLAMNVLALVPSPYVTYTGARTPVTPGILNQLDYQRTCSKS